VTAHKVARYTYRIMNDLRTHGRVTIPYGNGLTPAAARGRIYNAANRLGIRVHTSQDEQRNVIDGWSIEEGAETLTAITTHVGWWCPDHQALGIESVDPNRCPVGDLLDRAERLRTPDWTPDPCPFVRARVVVEEVG